MPKTANKRLLCRSSPAQLGRYQENKERIQEAESATQRAIELVCLKNRNGKPYFSCYFSYYPKYDLYVEEKPSPFIADH